ncbi:MAG: glycerophosphodiester phosphodiesterase family protein, partial [Anaerovoracaceae bacterium]
LLFMAIEGLRYLFTFHAVVLDGMTVKQGGRHAKKIMRENWRSFIPHYVLFIAIIAACALAVAGAALLIPDAIVSTVSPDAAGSKFFSVFIALLGSVLFWYFYEVMTPLMILELTRYYRMYTDGKKVFVPRAPKSRHIGRVVRIGALIAVLVILSGGMAAYFDTFFPKESTVGVVAHRTGGTLAPENSAEGIEKAASYGAIGSETDVQRTKDGKYIINHDDTFKRLYGVDKTPSQMTSGEIKKLRTKDGGHVPTLEELLETAKKKHIRLYIELKGSTADRKMVDDVVRIVRKKSMTKDVALISLKYDVLDYAESTYPEFETGYLYFLSYGDTTKLNVDDLIIEEQIATGVNIATLQLGGKKVLVWTVNEDSYLKKILAGNADGIITDEVAKAYKIKQQMKKRSNRERADDRINAWMS